MTSTYLLAAIAAEQDQEFRQRVITACEHRGEAFSEQVLLHVLLRFKHTLAPISQVVSVDVPISDANIDTALNELFEEDANGDSD